MDDTTLVMENISKVFPGVNALDSVNFDLKKGEIHALAGENGAGKSTLIKVLTGVYPIDGGQISLDGKPVHFGSTMDAERHGISTVYQEINLCPNLSVAENIYIGREPKKGPFIDWKTMNQNAEKLLFDRLNIRIDAKKLLSSYSIAVQQLVAIARAVDTSRGILILDEPTSSLDKGETAKLFDVMRSLKSQGFSIIFVTHFLDQIYEISDRITILRNGKLVGSYPIAELSQIELVSKMIGREMSEIEKLESIKKSSKKISDQTIVEAEDYGKRGLINPFGLKIKKGEVLGFAGLLGSGRTEVASLLFGIEKADHGVMTIGGKKYTYINPKRAIDEGFGFCPEDRKDEGIAGDLTIRENIILAMQANRGVFKYLPMKTQEEITQKYIELLSIKTPSMEQKIKNLSGGNQQKVILARWLATNPQILILDEPTRGIDIGAKSEIQKLILNLSREGMTIIFISSELPEIIRCCDRVIVLRDKKVIGELESAEITEANIMQSIAKGRVVHEQHVG